MHDLFPSPTSLHLEKLVSLRSRLLRKKAAAPPPSMMTPCSAVAEIFSMRVYLLLITTLDPLTKARRNVMLAWDEKDWFIVSQTTPLIYIGTQEVNSVIAAWGTDGSKLVPLLTTPSTTLAKRLSTKLYGAAEIFLQKTALAFYAQGFDKSAAGAGVTMTGTVDNGSNSYAMPHSVVFPAPNPGGTDLPPTSVFAAGSGDVVGFNLGFTLTSTSLDFTIENLALAYQHESSLFG
jgi:hypothetical protein